MDAATNTADISRGTGDIGPHTTIEHPSLLILNNSLAESEVHRLLKLEQLKIKGHKTQCKQIIVKNVQRAGAGPEKNLRGVQSQHFVK